MDAPKVSVVMPVYNAQRYVREAMDSILSQTFSDLEFVIVNDGSTDGTAEVLRSYSDSRIRLLNHGTNLGIVASLNDGLEIARGELVARQDADDVSLPNRLEEQVSLFDRHPDLVIVGSAYFVIDENGTPMGVVHLPTSDTAIRWEMLFHPPFCHTSVMFRGEPVRRNGLCYDPQVIHSQDFRLWSRLYRYGRVLNVAHPLVKRRRHPNQVGVTASTIQKSTSISTSRSNLQRLGFHISEAEVGTLREWYDAFPEELSEQDIGWAKVLFDMMDKFETEPNVDPDIVRGIRRRWVDRILGSVPPKKVGALWKSGVLGRILRHEAPSFFVHVSRRAMRRMKGVLRRT